MKIYCLILLLMLSACSCLNGPTNKKRRNIVPSTVPLRYRPLQEFGKDTIAYIRANFIIDKEFYVNRNIKTLLSKIEVPITNYAIHNGGDDLAQCVGITFTLIDPRKSDQLFLKKVDPGILIVEFREPFPINDILPLIRKNKGAWTIEEKNFFSSKIIKDIGTTRFK